MYPLLHHHRVYFNFGNPCCITNQNQNQNQNQLCAGVSAWLRRKSTSVIAVLPSRDRVIDFGKYKGKMLGSLPSSYLRWVSKNLRAREFEEWANLADEVLRDPIYRDRIEWEFALNVLSGNSSSSRVSRPTGGAVSELQDISERFGWDNLDKVGWSKVDFDLLGTSKGGRIPRLANLNLTDTDAQPKHPPTPTPTPTPTPSTVSRRMERRERQKMRLRRTQAQQQKIDVVADENTIHVNEDDHDNYNIANPFPGRQALLQLKPMNHHSSRFVS